MRRLQPRNRESRQVGRNAQIAVLARFVAVLGHPPAFAVLLDRIARQLDGDRHGDRREILAHLARTQFVFGHHRHRLGGNHHVVVDHPDGDDVGSLTVDDRDFRLLLLGDRPFVGLGPLNLRNREGELFAAVAGERCRHLRDRSGFLGNGHLLDFLLGVAFHGLGAGDQRRSGGHACRGHHVFSDVFHRFCILSFTKCEPRDTRTDSPHTSGPCKSGSPRG